MKFAAESEIQIPNTGNVIKLMSDGYEREEDALSDYIQNAVDSKATEVRLTLDKKRGRIIIADNSEGLDDAGYRRVAANFALSDKVANADAYAKNASGNKGVGFHAFWKFTDRGSEMRHFSKRGDKVFAAILTHGSTKVKHMEPADASYYAGDTAFEPMASEYKNGVTIIISGVRKEAFLSGGWASQGYVNKIIERKWREKLLDRSVRIFTRSVLAGHQEWMEIKPDQFEGERVFENVPVKFIGLDGNKVEDSVVIELFVNHKHPREKSVALYVKGVNVVQIGDWMPTYKSTPLCSEYVAGYIKINFGNPNTGRTNFSTTSPEAVVIKQAIDGIMQRVAKTVERHRKDKQSAEENKRSAELTRHIRDFMEALDAPMPPNAGPVKGKTKPGDNKTALTPEEKERIKKTKNFKSLEDLAKAVNTKPHDNVNTPDRPLHPKEKGGGGTKPRERFRGYGFSVKLRPFGDGGDAKKVSYAENSIIHINTAHYNYVALKALGKADQFEEIIALGHISEKIPSDKDTTGAFFDFYAGYLQHRSGKDLGNVRKHEFMAGI